MVRPAVLNTIPNGWKRISLSLVKRNRQASTSIQCTSCYYSAALLEQPHTLNLGRRFGTTVKMAHRKPMKTRSSDGKVLAEVEEAARNRKLELSSLPVTATSSVRHIFGEIGDKPEPEDENVDMVGNLKSEVVRIPADTFKPLSPLLTQDVQNAIRETFSLSDAPQEAYYIGLAGVAPYLATSLSTWYCAWEIKNEFGFLVSRDSAEALLHILEPLQIGYGAVVSLVAGM